MDGESLTAAGLLAALSRVAGVLAELRHPFVRSAPFSYVVPPAGVRVGTLFTLPDGREVSFEVSIAVVDGGFQVEGGVTAESDVLLGLPVKRLPDIEVALAVLDDYAGDVAAGAGRLIDRLLDAIV
ncbi:hypothetical protein ABZW11_21580 [Nonomuraea sp. NPDC004580]|uniref:hypothetical protein n=1 Tax=Nonomuraea sp. NPDC004580 TaxID=3154552 RepID=UPI0033A88881